MKRTTALLLLSLTALPLHTNAAESDFQNDTEGVRSAGTPDNLHRFIKDSEEIRDRMHSTLTPRTGVEPHRYSAEFQKEIDQPEVVVEQIPGDTSGQVIKKVNDMRYQVYEDQPFEKVGSIYRPVPIEKYNLSKIQNIEARLDTIEGKLDTMIEKLSGSTKREST